MRYYLQSYKIVLYILQARRNHGRREGGRGAGRIGDPQIFATVDLLLIDNDSEKKKQQKKYKLVQISRKLLVTLVLSTSFFYSIFTYLLL